MAADFVAGTSEPGGLAHRVIPTILCRGRELVKGERFDSWRSIGVAEQAARIHGMREVDELVMLDIAATREHRGPDLALVSAVAASMTTPLAVGGGIRSVHDVQDLLRAGADKVIICTAAFENPDLITEIASRVGCQALVVAIDVKNLRIVTHSGGRILDTRPALDAIAAQAKGAEDRGAGEILLTSVDREGTLSGYDLELIKAVAERLTIPLIAHGGCGSYYDMRLAIRAGADAVAAGALFQFTDATPASAAEYLRTHGIEARVARGASHATG